ncbi:MAG: hypothetical protein WCP12_16110 [bacterium]
MIKANIELTIDQDGCQLTAYQNGIPLCEWSGDIASIGIGFLELVTLLEQTN